MVLAVLVAAFIFIINHMGALGVDVNVALKYILIGLICIIALGIISVTLIALAGIFVGVPFIRNLLGGNGTAWSRRGRWNNCGNGLGETVGGSIRSAMSGMRDFRNMSARTVSLDIGKYDCGCFKIKNMSGDIKLQGHDLPGMKAELEIMEKIQGDTEAFFEEGEIKLKTKSGNRSFIGDAKIYLPAGLADISAESVSGDIDASGFSNAGEITLKAVNGDVSVEKINNSAEISLKTVSGDLRIKESALNSLIMQTVNGDIDVKESTAEAAVLKTVSGDIDYSGSSIKNPSIKTVSGSVES